MAGNQYPRAAGYNQLPNGLFTPDIFSMKMLDLFYEEAIVPNITNLDYEGEIRNMGDRVNIRQKPAIETHTYNKGQALLHQVVDDAQVQLLINKGQYWCVPIDDIDRRQTDVAWVEALQKNAAIQLKLDIEADVLGSIYADVAAANVMTDRTLTPNNIPDLLVDAGVLLDEAFAPREGRFAVVPYWFKGHLKLNPTFVSANKMGDGKSIIRGGPIGQFDDFTIYCSPNLAVVSTYTQVLFGTKAATTFATQYVKTETLRNPFTFGDVMRGVQVYGYEVLYPSFLVSCGVLKG